MTDQPMPAEAASELGADQDVRGGMQMLAFWLMAALVLLCAAGLVVDF